MPAVVMRPALHHSILLVAIACFCPSASFVHAVDDTESITIQAVKIGIDGKFKSGFWTPIHIDLRNGADPFRGEIEIIVPDSDGVATRFQWQDSAPIELAGGESKTITRYVKMGRSKLPIQIELRAGDMVATQRTVSVSELAASLPAEREWILVLGSEINVRDALGRNSRTGMNTIESYLPEVELFPDQWLGLESVDVVVLTTSDLTKLAAISARQLNALHEWILKGGRLIISVGRNGKQLLEAGGRLSALVPGRFVEVAVLKNLAALESYSASTQRIEFSDKSDSVIPVTNLADVRGTVELSDTVADETRPLIVRTPMGFGQTTFIGFDLELRSVANWEGRSRILARVLQTTTQMDQQRRGDSSNTHVARFGYQDLVGQLRSALDQFPGVQLVALWWVAALVTFYVVLIGPVDYFLLRDVLRRMTLTWITFPLVTLIFVGLVFYLGPRWKGNDVLVNQIDLVDVDTVSSHFRSITWAHVYSPRSATYEMQCMPNDSLATAVSLHGNILSWQGLPGTGLGGLETAAAAPPSINEYRLVFSNSESSADGKAPTLEASLHGVPIQVAATKSLVGRSWGQIELEGETKITMDPDGLPRGEVCNPLPVELQDCVVYFGNWAFRLEATRGVLAPGQKTRIELERALNLRWRLTGRRVIDTKDVGTPWDQHTLEVPRIMEMMMFHEAAGGDSYTQLINRYQASIDLSQQLVLQRAILIGRTPQPAINLKLNDAVVAADQQWTYYRIVYPLSNSP